jgi:peptidoglycan/xylan/chitin deacetylase (PgdA/CDA1 family)
VRPFHYGSIAALLAIVLLLALQVSWWWILLVVVVYLHLLILGAIYIRWNFYLKSLCKGKNKQWICLSFDDGPATQTAAILDILKLHNVPAVFFTIGKNAVSHPELVKRWDEEGHIIGNHSYSHGFNFDWQSSKKMCEEIEETNGVIRDITGKKPLLFRPPYGVTNPNLSRAVRQTKMHSIAWSVRSFDTSAKDPQQLLARILNQLQGGDIILMHDSMPITKEILTELIIRTRENGFTFVPLDQMLDINAYA